MNSNSDYQRPLKNLNAIFFNYNEKPIYIVCHHSIVLRHWLQHFKDSKEKKIDLFHIDRHSDMCITDGTPEKSKVLLELTKEELDNFINYELSPNNQEFIINAMLSGIISKTITINYKKRFMLRYSINDGEKR